MTGITRRCSSHEFTHGTSVLTQTRRLQGKWVRFWLRNALECGRHLQRSSVKSLIRGNTAKHPEAHYENKQGKAGNWFRRTGRYLAKASTSHSAARASNPFQVFFPLKPQTWALFCCFVVDRRMVSLEAAIYKDRQFLDFLRVQDLTQKNLTCKSPLSSTFYKNLDLYKERRSKWNFTNTALWHFTAF